MPAPRRCATPCFAPNRSTTLAPSGSTSWLASTVLDTDGSPLGVVAAVEANPASDLLVLDTGVLIPLRFVTATGEGWLRVELPPGLVDL